MKHYNWLVQNTKIAKMSGVKTYNWGIPAYKSRSGMSTCPNAAACAKGCYATMGAYRFSNVAKVFEKRLRLTMKGPRFIETIDAEIKRRNVKRLRIHDSGDFYSLQYTMNWISIIRRNPTAQFYAYTKMVKMFKMLQHDPDNFPANLTVIYSYGGTEDKLINNNYDRHSWVFATLTECSLNGYADASQDDAIALGKNHRVGLIYHGTKNIENTDWFKAKKGV